MKRALTCLLVAVTASACGGSPAPSVPAAPTGPVPVPVPTPLGPTRLVSGVVSESIPHGLRPVASEHISAWYQLDRYGYHGGNASTDAQGRYRLLAPPDAFTVLFAGEQGYVQPCAAAASLTADTVLDIQLLTEATAAAGRPETLKVTSPIVSGTVFETTPQGRRPFAGAKVWAEWLPDLPTATTITDAQGRYLLCAIPKGYVGITATALGGILADTAIQVSTADVVLDLEVKH
jgi:hypothetical protein